MIGVLKVDCEIEEEVRVPVDVATLVVFVVTIVVVFDSGRFGDKSRIRFPTVSHVHGEVEQQVFVCSTPKDITDTFLQSTRQESELNSQYSSFPDFWVTNKHCSLTEHVMTSIPLLREHRISPITTEI